MLGCQDFCGYYDWTFHYLRRRFGQQAVDKLLSEAIAFDSQQHYVRAGQEQGLRGLYDSWTQTGDDEQCDWTVTLIEEQNLLRLDMQQCPSKGFLLDHDLHAHEDYCDHCIGWIGPALESIDTEVTAHEHNHCGQCWWEFRKKNQPCPPVEVDADIRNDPRWNHGFLDRYANSNKLPIFDRSDSFDPCQVLLDWFASVDHLLVVGNESDDSIDRRQDYPTRAAIVIDYIYAENNAFDGEVKGVLVDECSTSLPAIAERFHSTPSDRRPLLMCTFLPAIPQIDFLSSDLPRPIPILPMLIRAGLYVHQPNQPSPTTGVFALLLAEALGKEVTIVGVDLSRHPSGTKCGKDQHGNDWPSRLGEGAREPA